MHVAVIGAGIVGVTTAYELAADGHRVTVFEQRGSVAAEGSFASAGLVAPGYVLPLTAAAMPRAPAWPWSPRRAGLALRGVDLASVGWLWRWWRATDARTCSAQRQRLQRLAEFSRDRLREVTLALRLDYERADGCLVLFRSAADQVLAEPGLASLQALGTRVETLDAAACRVVEPGLSAETPLHGGIWLPNDEVGNCREFAYLLRHEAERLGVRFRFHTTVLEITAGADPAVTSIHAPPRETPLRNPADSVSRDAQDTLPMAEGPRSRPFDTVVVCAALGATALLRRHGLRLPLLPVHGYSVTAPLRRSELYPDRGPRAAVVDERYQVVISRLGARVRVAGGAEIGGVPTRLYAGAIDRLHRVLHDWFPGATLQQQAQHWKGARPVLPDGPPLLGASGVAGVWLNLGHGDNGWALACGSARLIADLLAGRPPSTAVEGLGIERLHPTP